MVIWRVRGRGSVMGWSRMIRRGGPKSCRPGRKDRWPRRCCALQSTERLNCSQIEQPVAHLVAVRRPGRQTVHRARAARSLRVCPQQGGALPHPAGELVRVIVGKALQAENRQHLHDPAVAASRGSRRRAGEAAFAAASSRKSRSCWGI